MVYKVKCIHCKMRATVKFSNPVITARSSHFYSLTCFGVVRILKICSLGRRQVRKTIANDSHHAARQIQELIPLVTESP